MRKPFSLILAIAMPMLAHGQNSAPKTEPVVNTIPVARDIAHPGVITLFVDASDVTRGIFRVKETIPVKPGPAVLLFPKWIPGTHSASGPLMQFAGLKLTANGKPLPWRRDPLDVYAFRVEVPQDATSIDAQFQFLSATESAQGRIVTTPDMLNLQWNSVVIYPAGYYVKQIQVSPSVKLPDGWKLGSALEVAGQNASTFQFKQVDLDTLVDSPIFAGANARIETLAPGIRLNIFADLPEQLAATEEQIQAHRNLVTQGLKLFGTQHFDHYDFLLALSDRQSGIGLEHLRSSENGVPGNYFTEWKDSFNRRQLLPHEYVHSWNGKYRRPADLWTPDFRTPMQNRLLWVYEGQTQYWGIVLAARSGLLSKEQTLGSFANIAASLDLESGRKWRPMEDTTFDPIFAQRRPKGWRSWQRTEDYYNEGALLWLDADSLIRELSGGKRSLDDFALSFFRKQDGDSRTLTYRFEDVVKTLNEVQPHDWTSFLRERLENVTERAPLDGIKRGGYKLVFTETPTDWFKANEKARKISDFSHSGGFVLNKEGEVTDVIWDGPAFNAGLTVGSRLVALNGRSFDADKLKAAIKSKAALSLLIKAGDVYRTVDLDYRGGLRYPRLERLETPASALDDILSPKP